MPRGNKKGYRGTLAERFERNTMPEPNSGCLLWLGAARGHDGNSYGVIRDDGKQTTATHVALKLAGRAVPAGLFALHRCDNTYCVNADHLFVGTLKENNADAIAKGRNNPHGKLSAEQRAHLIARVVAGEPTKLLTKEFKVTRQTLYKIRQKNRSVTVAWSDVEGCRVTVRTCE